MNNRVNYKGYVIEAQPDQLQDGRWQVNIFIEKHTGADVRVRHAHAKSAYATEAEATIHSLEFGKQVIDGRYPQVSVSDL